MDASKWMLVMLGVGISVFVVVKLLMGVRYRIKAGKVQVKVPKLKGRSKIYSEEDGILQVVGYERIGASYDEAILSLLTESGQILKPKVHKDELEPVNAIQAIAGLQPALWRIKGKRTPKPYVDIAQYEAEQEITELREDMEVLSAKKEIAVNQAARLPEDMIDLIKELQKPKVVEVGKGIK